MAERKIISSISVYKHELDVIDELAKRLGVNRSKALAISAMFMLGSIKAIPKMKEVKSEEELIDVIKFANSVLEEADRKNVIELEKVRKKYQ